MELDLCPLAQKRPGGENLLGETGKPALELEMAHRQQCVQLVAVRSARPRPGRGQVVGVEDDDLVGLITEDTCGQEPAETSSEHYRVLHLSVSLCSVPFTCVLQARWCPRDPNPTVGARWELVREAD
ncbi:hypothetical protein GCM10010394_48160 [Streptomyces crystallinus]|uniref:Uncharacterized protein n=1 Tax=Streptomyces crystallinus TaxID=68191 RepID=A0ABN1GJ75_9ACTN